MEPDYQHKVLIADEDETVSKTVARVLRNEDIIFVFSDNGESALEEIKTRKKPFSIIIANQGLRGMKGETLLDYAKNHSSESSRFLMGTYSEFSAIIDAVNKDLIQRYIVKPLADEDFLNAVKYGIRFFESFFENDRLMNLAKKQNSQLYDLSRNLMEAAAKHTKEIHELDQEIDILEKKLLSLSALAPVSQKPALDMIESGIKNDTGIDPQKVQFLFSGLIKTLYHEFNGLARQKGFEMPVKESESA
ncbi:MAG: hypothetical protein A2277_03865 [Desulfobacterales bacterium RIFOXYA12_FULL_46_15]|nr:MAG: hypothetical protein A2097_06435 [Desulfobacula sp. GWF2_41_7]OGR22624.1 MAG: hypothetical protein A2277_03865 [Desulfobacterales bacterium RIFOXYA12_FULL_46_15]